MAESAPPPVARSGRAHWLLPALVLVVACAVYGVTAAASLVSLDVRSAYLASWTIAETGSPWIEGLSLPELENDARSTWVIEAANGHTVIGRSPGTVLAGLPGYWSSGGSTFAMAPGALTAALLTGTTILLLFLTLRRLTTTLQALVGAAATGFTTPVWSVAANGIWPHTITILGIAGMAWATTSKRWWLVGLFGGVVLWGRLHAAVIVAIFGLFLAWRRRSPGIAIRIGIVGAVALALISVWSRWMYGTWSPTASYDTTVFENYALDHRFDPLNQLAMWVALDRGILVWTPVILLLLPGLVRGWASLPDWSRGLLLGGLAYTLLQATLNHFKGGEGFYGYRLTLELLMCAAPALVLSARYLRLPVRRLLGPVLALQFVAFMVGSSADFFVPGGNGWWDNAFLLAVRTHPAALVPLTLLCLAVGVLVQRRLEEMNGPTDTDPHSQASRPVVTTQITRDHA